MAEADFAVGLNARERALRQVELGHPLIEAVASAEIDVGAQLLRVRQRVLDLDADAGPGARLRDERRKNSVGPRRANRLLLLRLGAIDRQREARTVSHERAVDVPCVLPRLARRPLARERVARVHRVVSHVHVERVPPAAAAGARAHFDARAAIAASRGIVVPDADFLNLRAGRQSSAGEPVDADVGVLSDELLQHLRELFGIVGQRGELFCRQLLGECAEQLRVVIGRQNVDLLGQTGDFHHDIAVRLRARAHAKFLDVDRREAGRFDRERCSRPASVRRRAPRHVHSPRRCA